MIPEKSELPFNEAAEGAPTPQIPWRVFLQILLVHTVNYSYGISSLYVVIVHLLCDGNGSPCWYIIYTDNWIATMLTDQQQASISLLLRLRLLCDTCQTHSQQTRMQTIVLAGIDPVG